MRTPRDDASFLAPTPRTSVERGPRPSFSVIVAAWQAASTIGDAIGSALAQREAPREIIVCDDGSTDDLVAALAPFEGAVRLIRIPHQGAAVARNTAAACCSGDLLVPLDADDAWDPCRLQRIADLAALRPDLDLITTDAWLVVDGERRGRFYDFNRFPVRDQASEILHRNFFFAHVAVRRSRWLESGGYDADLARGEDWDLWLRLLLGGCVAGCVLEPLADYRVHGSSLSASRFESLMARVAVLDKAERAHCLSEPQRAALSSARSEYRRRALAARAEQLVMTGAPGRRRASIALLCASGVPPRTRLRSAAAAIAPGLAGSRVRRQAALRGRAASDRVVGTGKDETSPPDGDDE